MINKSSKDSQFGIET